jgi:hypothetical protein
MSLSILAAFPHWKLTFAHNSVQTPLRMSLASKQKIALDTHKGPSLPRGLSLI